MKPQQKSTASQINPSLLAAADVEAERAAGLVASAPDLRLVHPVNPRISHKRQHFASSQTFAQDDVAPFVHADQMKNSFCDINAPYAKLLWHGIK